MQNKLELAAPRRLLRTLELAEALGLSDRYVRQQAARGLIRTVHFGRRVFIPRTELDRLIEEGLDAGDER